MSTGETIGIIILTIVVLGIRILRYYYSYIRKRDFTVCPNCEKTKPRVKKGKYKCDSCGFIFEVDKQGDAIMNSLWANILIIGFGIFLTIQLIRILLHEETPIEKMFNDLNAPSTFETIFYPTVFIILIIIFFYHGIKGIIGFMNDKKTTHNNV